MKIEPFSEDEIRAIVGSEHFRSYASASPYYHDLAHAFLTWAQAQAAREKLMHWPFDDAYSNDVVLKIVLDRIGWPEEWR